ncbi:MAG: carboxypeptidase regulatory-like domain-containing protein, partial [Pyrinomonadaceae bacterium]
MTAKCRRSPLTRILIAVGLLLALAPAGMAQSGEPLGAAPAVYALPPTATLDGTVVDEHDAVVADASVLVKEVKGKLERRSRTSRDGSFVFPLLPLGNYNVAVERRGFLPAEVRDVVLKVNDHLPLKIRLKVGHVGETVTVKAALARSSPAVATTIDRGFAENLPLNARTLQPLILRTPGAVQTKSTFTDQGQFSFNGQRANANYFMLDGVSANIGVAAGA